MMACVALGSRSLNLNDTGRLMHYWPEIGKSLMLPMRLKPL